MKWKLWPAILLVILLISGMVESGNVGAQKFDDPNVQALHESLKGLQEKADQGDPEAQTGLGMIYYYGFAGSPDYVVARAWMEKAAAQNYPEALVMLGSFYENGIGVEENPVKARELFQQAADLNYPRGLFRLAFTYLVNPKEENDLTKGRELLDQSCAAGYQTACAVPMMMDNDLSGARVILDSQCQAGDQEACGLLAQLGPVDNTSGVESNAESTKEVSGTSVYLLAGLIFLLVVAFLLYRFGRKEKVSVENKDD